MQIHIDLPPDISSLLAARAAAHHCEPQEEVLAILQSELSQASTVSDDPALDRILAIRARILQERGGQLFSDSTEAIAKARRDELE